MTKSNVNPNHYKKAGRGRQGEDIVQEIHKQNFTQADGERAGQPGTENFIPGAAPIGVRPSEADDEASSAGTESVDKARESADS